MFKEKLLRRLMRMLMGIQFMAVEDEGGGPADPPADNTPPADGGKQDDKPKDDPKDDKPKDGKLSDTEANLLRELMEKKTALKDTGAKLANLEAELAKYSGINLEEVQALLQERKDAETQKLEQKGEWERLKQNLVDQHNSELTTLKGQIEALNQQLANKEGSINQLTIGSAFSMSSFIADDLTLTPAKAQIIYGSHFDYEDGKIVGYDKPRGSANRTMLIDSQGEPLAFDQAMKKVIESDPDKDRLIRAKARPGANSRTEDTPPKQGKVEVKGQSRITAALNTPT